MNSVKVFTIALGIVAVVLMLLSTLVARTHANPSAFSRQNNGITTTATTTQLGYMSVGAATTTAYFDSQANGNPYSADSAVLLWQLTASSTNSTQDVYLEYAQGGSDCISIPTSCDWFAYATSTSLSSTHYFARWQFASTSQGQANPLSTNNRAMREIAIPTPTRYVRAVFVVPHQLFASGLASSSAVWAEIVAKKQQ